MLLENFDASEGIITPWESDLEKAVPILPKTLIMPFDKDINRQITQDPRYQEIGVQHSIVQDAVIGSYECGMQKFTIAGADLGAPALIGRLEELMSGGIENVILFGTCGVLDKNIAAHQLIIPTSAIRDEGTSFHYVPASDEIQMNPNSVAKLTMILDELNVAYTTAKTWTTDAFFRETPEKAKERIAMGCSVVDMEASAVAAWARYRHKNVYQFFYTADHLNIETGVWDRRSDERAQAPSVYDFFELALEIGIRLK
ncbi:MAG: nucleoside phosphorylase [Liquorilactobacillus mali]|uniref:nucleoside phosphorylase n=1 Tax=Liquorilactobacillus mali TaxID=1618 RepID=UPI0039E9C550